jgi:hypothetical protein
MSNAADRITLRVTDISALTKGCWVVITWAHKTKSPKERHKFFC